MYWVFEENQLKQATDEWLARNTTDSFETKEAFKSMLNDFLRSDAVRNRNMLRGNDK